MSTLKKFEKYKDRNGFIDGFPKIKTSFSKVYLDKLFYLDFYSIERFGKTKLGQFLLYAKQSQDKKLIKSLAMQTRPRIDSFIKRQKVDCVGFVPPTVKREVQFMKILEKELDLKIRSLKITKIKTEVIIPQKTLNKLDDRIENAKKTFVVENQSLSENILLIDDAVGSGATLNEIARQIKSKNLCKGKVIGLAITGSFKGFDVISEV